MAAPLR